MEKLVRFLERITSGAGCLAALIAIPLIVAICYEVFARYAFGAPTVWAYELGYMLTGSHFILGAALTLKLRGHVRIDLIYGHLTPRAQARIDLFFYVLVFLPFLLLVSDALLDYALSAHASGERSGQSAWNPPIWPFRMIIAGGFMLLGLQVIAEILKAAAVLRGRPLDISGEN